LTTGYEDSDDLSLLDLFRVELETNARILDTGLVNLEGGSSPHSIEPLMRAAHSIKGAARIVGLDSAVTLAHAMEDLLEAARLERLQISGDQVDILLRANDIFLRLSTLNPRDMADALVREDTVIRETCSRLRAELAAPAESSTQPPEPAPQNIPADSGEAPSLQKPTPADGQSSPSGPPAAEPLREESSVRVLAENLNRLIGLAGESLVRAKSAKPLSVELFKLKSGYSWLSEKLEELLLSPRFGKLPEDVSEIIGDSLHELDALQESLVHLIERFEHFSRRLEYTSERMYDEAVAGRMRPFSDCLHGYPRLVRDLCRDLGKKARLVIEGASILVDRDILERLEAPLTHLIRNALDHGIETPDRRREAGKPPEGKIHLEARHVFGMLNITIRDDGRGIDRGRLREKILREERITAEMADHLSTDELFDFLFLPGFSTAERVTEISGRGVGLDVVASMVHSVGGSFRVHSEEGAGTTIHLQLPLTLSVLRTLLVDIAGESYAIPLARIGRVLEVDPAEIKTVEDRQFCTVDGEHVGIIEARQVLQLPGNGDNGDMVRIAIISDRLTRYGLVVDRFRGQRELVVRPLDPRLGKVPNISAGALLDDGTPSLIFDVDDLVRSIDNRLAQGRLQKVGDRVHKRDEVHKRILVVDDSLTVRQVERKLLENRGYEVAVAVDGMDGWNTLQGERFDLVITDVDMPRMNGIDLVRRIKENPSLRILPVMIISYKDREEDRKRGLEAGANYYLTKSSFHDESLLDAVRDLIGEPQ
jgi:two-component system sensor histidine kinase and response regulator WspE